MLVYVNNVAHMHQACQGDDISIIITIQWNWDSFSIAWRRETKRLQPKDWVRVRLLTRSEELYTGVRMLHMICNWRQWNGAAAGRICRPNGNKESLWHAGADSSLQRGLESLIRKEPTRPLSRCTHSHKWPWPSPRRMPCIKKRAGQQIADLLFFYRLSGRDTGIWTPGPELHSV